MQEKENFHMAQNILRFPRQIGGAGSTKLPSIFTNLSPVLCHKRNNIRLVSLTTNYHEMYRANEVFAFLRKQWLGYW